MDDGFIAKPLAERQIDQAYPLVRQFAPDLVVERWRAFALAMITPDVRAGADKSPRTGIMTIQNGNGYINGLFSYRAEESLIHGRVLCVDNFVVLDLFNLSLAAAALLREMDRLARSLDCGAIHTNLPESYASLPDYRGLMLNFFREQGHAVETARLCKPLSGANDNRALATAARGKSD